jgi:exo-beta-1,3-glucanase (GH17 family)
MTDATTGAEGAAVLTRGIIARSNIGDNVDLQATTATYRTAMRAATMHGNEIINRDALLQKAMEARVRSARSSPQVSTEGPEIKVMVN